MPYYAIDESTGCWEWDRCRSDRGYGTTRYNGQQVGAHRAFYAHFVGDVPAGMVVMHECDNPPCVNPDHLRLGTQFENMGDMVARGRHFGPGLGDNNPATKLSPDDVVQVFAMRAAGMYQYEIAAHFGVSQPAIMKVLQRRSHWHVEVPEELLRAVA